VRRSSVLILVALAGAGALLALVPFGRPGPRGSYTYSSRSTLSWSCGSPVVSAWRQESMPSGWFGYAPLTAEPIEKYEQGLHVFAMTGPPAACTETARRRLALGALLMVPGALVWFLRRRRFAPPANPGPNLAT
jgi:hypothetical protein